MERRPWNGCPKCGSVFDEDTPCCPACGTNSPFNLHLTHKEVVERVWPNIQLIWTKQPSLFFQPVEEVRKEKAQALLEAFVHILRARKQALLVEESAKEAVLT